MILFGVVKVGYSQALSNAELDLREQMLVYTRHVKLILAQGLHTV